MNDITANNIPEPSPIDLWPDLEYKGEDALGMTVFVVEITHRHGTDLIVCASEARAYTALARYAREWWHEVEFEAGPIDDLTDDEAADLYFETQMNAKWHPEMYEIYSLDVG